MSTAALPSKRYTLPSDGFIQIVPKGTFPHPSGYIQVVDDLALKNMAENYRASGRDIPFHIDHYEDLSQAEREKLAEMNIQLPSDAIGWLKNFDVRENGLYAEPMFTTKGRELVESGAYRLVSPTFPLKNCDRLDGADGKRVRPTVVKSVSATNEPCMKAIEMMANRGLFLANSEGESALSGAAVALENSGTSEGAEKGWETRRGGGASFNDEGGRITSEAEIAHITGAVKFSPESLYWMRKSDDADKVSRDARKVNTSDAHRNAAMVHKEVADYHDETFVKKGMASLTGTYHRAAQRKHELESDERSLAHAKKSVEMDAPAKPADDSSPLARLRHHVTGAIERGEKEAIVERPAAKTADAFDPANHARLQREYESVKSLKDSKDSASREKHDRAYSELKESHIAQQKAAAKEAGFDSVEDWMGRKRDDVKNRTDERFGAEIMKSLIELLNRAGANLPQTANETQVERSLETLVNRITNQDSAGKAIRVKFALSRLSPIIANREQTEAALNSNFDRTLDALALSKAGANLVNRIRDAIKVGRIAGVLFNGEGAIAEPAIVGEAGSEVIEETPSQKAHGASKVADEFAEQKSTEAFAAHKGAEELHNAAATHCMANGQDQDADYHTALAGYHGKQKGSVANREARVVTAPKVNKDLTNRDDAKLPAVEGAQEKPSQDQTVAALIRNRADELKSEMPKGTTMDARWERATREVKSKLVTK